VEKRWIRLDNASNIFLAARNNIDTKVFRLSAEIKDAVNPVLLQKALENIYQEYPLFQSTLRRGIFWYYLEKSEKKPKVRIETDAPVMQIYHYDRRELLFRVLYRNKQIHFEVFHALTDGTGAMWFFEDLLVEYARLRYIKKQDHWDRREKADTEDSFKRYFKKGKSDTKLDQTTESLEPMYAEKKMDEQHSSENQVEPKGNIYRIKGEYTPDHRPRIIHLNVDVKEALELSRKEGVSLTIYMTAVYVLAVYQAKPNKEKETTISVSIPINLRQFFPSISVRNFFSTVTVSYSFKKNEKIDFSDICKELDRQLKSQLKKEELEKRLKRYIDFEFNPLIRLLPRVVKDGVLKIINKWNNRQTTVAMSNLGMVHLPEEMSGVVEDIYFYTSVIRPQFCMVSYGGHLNISFTSPFIETTIHQNFVRYLSEQGLDLTVDVNKVTAEELENDESLQTL